MCDDKVRSHWSRNERSAGAGNSRAGNKSSQCDPAEGSCFALVDSKNPSGREHARVSKCEKEMNRKQKIEIIFILYCGDKVGLSKKPTGRNSAVELSIRRSITCQSV
ncbi:MAG: hypothetical protein K9G60_02790 [Pseudolabrys sp.]|nr:hypothetical protein [Pseudolabrys sp.]